MSLKGSGFYFEVDIDVVDIFSTILNLFYQIIYVGETVDFIWSYKSHMKE